MHHQPFHPTLKTIPNLANLKTKKEIGTKLWNAITNKEEFQNLYTQSGTAILPIVIKSDNPQIQALPWELLYHPTYSFLATHPKFTLSRAIPNLPKVAKSIKKEPLRVLFFSTLPDDLSEAERLSVEREQEAVLTALMPSIQKGLVEIWLPNDGRFNSLKDLIAEHKPHLLFLSGHSSYVVQKGSFLFEDKRGLKVEIDEDELASAFWGSDVSCVVFSSCQSAKADPTKLNSGLARSLAFRGVEHVVGMSESLYDRAGIEFAKQFILALAKQKTLVHALQEGRGAIGEIKDTLIASHAFLPLLFSQDIYNWGVNTPSPNMPPYGIGGFSPEQKRQRRDSYLETQTLVA